MEGWWKWCLAGAGGTIGIALIKWRVAGRQFRSNALMAGKTVVITGANVGLGKETARELVKRKARVILACRDPVKGKQTASDIRRSTDNGEMVVKKLDLASFASIREFVKEINDDGEKVDVLINNAGVFQCPLIRTDDGFEEQMGVNHLGHFLLTNLLIDKLKKSAPSRVVVVSSGLHKRGKIEFDNLNSEKKYDKKEGYSNSKLANNLFARELARRLEGTGVCVHCLHPGMARTSLSRYVEVPLILKALLYPLYMLLVKSARNGCQTILYCAIAEELENTTGRYYGNCQEEPWTQVSLDDGVAKKLWEISEKLTRLS